MFQYNYWLLSHMNIEKYFLKMHSLLDDWFYICLKSSENQKFVMLFVFRISSICSSINYIHFPPYLVQTKAPTYNKCCKDHHQTRLEENISLLNQLRKYILDPTLRIIFFTVSLLWTICSFLTLCLLSP